MSAESPLQPNGPLAIVACGVMKRELEKLRREKPYLEIRYLDQGLHRTPNKLAPLLQKQIDEVSKTAAAIVVGYGMCANGLIGVASRERSLIIPRCHDCIGFFLGSCAAYRRALAASPRTYYLTPGWLADRHDPLSIVEDVYTPRVGYETAAWAMQEELKHYTHFTLIVTEGGEAPTLRARALENAAFFDKKLQEIPGSLDYFKKFTEGPYTEEDFFLVPPGEQVTQEKFLPATLSHPIRPAAEKGSAVA